MCDVAKCKPVDFDTKAIDRLILNKRRKEVIRAMVHLHPVNHSLDVQDDISQRRTAEFTSHKNSGMIALLHGAPGTGKTYVSAPFRMRACTVLICSPLCTKTVECFAEAACRPLISLTSGNIGNDERTVERGLSKWFRLAERWGAVIVIDEADIFLAERQRLDMNSVATGSYHQSCTLFHLQNEPGFLLRLTYYSFRESLG